MRVLQNIKFYWKTALKSEKIVKKKTQLYIEPNTGSTTTIAEYFSQSPLPDEVWFKSEIDESLGEAVLLRNLLALMNSFAEEIILSGNELYGCYHRYFGIKMGTFDMRSMKMNLGHTILSIFVIVY